jgi:hypothetical protein
MTFPIIYHSNLHHKGFLLFEQRLVMIKMMLTTLHRLLLKLSNNVPFGFQRNRHVYML